MTRTLDPVHHPDPTQDDETPKTVTLSGQRQLAYAVYGCSDGISVVFLHGTPGSRRLGSLFGSIAEEYGIRVIAVDRPGYGRSSPWPEYTVDDAGTIITTVLDDVGVHTAGVIAFSGGAPYALTAARTHPDRITHVDIISGATPPAVSEDTPVIQQVLRTLATKTPAILRGLFRGQAWLAERLNPAFVAAQYTTKERAESLSDDVKETVKEDFIEAFAGSRRGAVTEFQQTATTWGGGLGEIDTDVVFWHGEHDTNVPITHVQRLNATIPTARLQTVDDADHLQTLLRSRAAVLDSHRS